LHSCFNILYWHLNVQHKLQSIVENIIQGKIVSEKPM